MWITDRIHEHFCSQELGNHCPTTRDTCTHSLIHRTSGTFSSWTSDAMRNRFANGPPNAAEIQRLLDTTTVRKAAAHYGISTAALYHWMRKLGCKTKRRVGRPQIHGLYSRNLNPDSRAKSAEASRRFRARHPNYDKRYF